MRALILDCDAVAALRDVAGAGEPRLVAIALAAELAGADGVRLSANESLRPVRESDLHDVRRVARVLEVRLAPTPSLLKLALEVRPDRVVLSSEPTGSKLLSAPLETSALRNSVPLALRALREAGIPCWARIAPDADSVKLARAAEVAGVELATNGTLDLPDTERAEALDRLGDAGRIATKLRLPIAASGAIERARLAELIAAAPALDRVVVGRSWSARALLVGLDRTVHELREALR